MFAVLMISWSGRTDADEPETDGKLDRYPDCRAAFP